MKKILLLLLLASLPGYAQNPKTIFTAHIQNRNSDTAYIQAYAYNFRVPLYATSNGTYREELQIVAGMYDFYDGKEYIRVFLRPGYDVTMRANAEMFDETVVFEGDGALENNLFAKKLLAYEQFKKSADSLGSDIKAVRRLFYKYTQRMYAWINMSKNIDALAAAFMRGIIKGEKKSFYKHAETLETVIELEGQPSPGFEFENYAGGITRLEDFKGKYVYISIWSTDCVTCLRQIVPLENYVRRLRNKNIAFVSISADKAKDEETWKAFIKDNGLHGIQLIADDDFDSDFMEDYSIKTIPRYILIGPDGTVINADAPRPSSPDLETLLNGLPGNE